MKQQADTKSARQPRQPERANGRKRYDLLLAAAERLLERDGAEGLSIQKLAAEAEVPMASVYHFFPSPAAISVALAETYREGFLHAVSDDVTGRSAMSWQTVMAELMRRAVAYYGAHPYAQALILGSELSWHFRRTDLANNRALAGPLMHQLEDKFPGVDQAELANGLAIAISIGDAVWAVSVLQHNTITPEFADEATLAVCSYLQAKFGPQAIAIIDPGISK